MRYLIDTHILIWFFESPSNLPLKIREEIRNNKNSVYLSSASLFEIAIKVSLGKLRLSVTFDEFLDRINGAEFEILHIRDEYLKYLINLPFIHKDPFDRLIISSALAEDLILITADENIHRYDISYLW
ncbi:MAG: type II toxin-antitoxin system VapC family toxin [Deferribacteraceae bacterium]|nr:type II toxin-antitoxin system VapC family toxin [Deferribacteraceae bacterium]